MAWQRITLDNSINQFDLLAHTANPQAILDVTQLDLARLPRQVKAVLHSNAEIFHVPDLRCAGSIEANKALAFIAPELRQAGDISATHAQMFEVPELRSAGNIHATSAAQFVARNWRRRETSTQSRRQTSRRNRSRRPATSTPIRRDASVRSNCGNAKRYAYRASIS